MGALKNIVAAVETRLIALGYTATDEVFNFDAVPDSIMDKAFRIEARQLSCVYDSGNIANPKAEITIWIAYKELRIPRTAWKTALDDQEAIEKDLMNAAGILALASNPLLEMSGEAGTQKEIGDYIISRIPFQVDFLRSLA